VTCKEEDGDSLRQNYNIVVIK